MTIRKPVDFKTFVEAKRNQANRAYEASKKQNRPKSYSTDDDEEEDGFEKNKYGDKSNRNRFDDQSDSPKMRKSGKSKKEGAVNQLIHLNKAWVESAIAKSRLRKILLKEAEKKAEQEDDDNDDDDDDDAKDGGGEDVVSKPAPVDDIPQALGDISNLLSGDSASSDDYDEDEDEGDDKGDDEGDYEEGDEEDLDGNEGSGEAGGYLEGHFIPYSRRLREDEDDFQTADGEEDESADEEAPEEGGIDSNDFILAMSILQGIASNDSPEAIEVISKLAPAIADAVSQVSEEGDGEKGPKDNDQDDLPGSEVKPAKDENGDDKEDDQEEKNPFTETLDFKKLAKMRLID